ncbi:MAG: hypothetical protein H7A35_06365 [Planctomycetales bacterium]|nr:hypothetical protein [bacterium]UNM09683.1 MAG: hypothetical protein H7A35_06365 [Planctomycetales bacterium]
MSIRVVVSDALNRRVPMFDTKRYAEFERAVADVVKGRAKYRLVHTSARSKRRYYSVRQGLYTLYYSVAADDPANTVFEEFLSDDEEDLIMDVFAEGHD